jgi:hypothetical protein
MERRAVTTPAIRATRRPRIRVAIAIVISTVKTPHNADGRRRAGWFMPGIRVEPSASQ